MPFTLSGLVARGKLKANELFTPARQDEAAIMLIERRGVSADMLRKQGMSVQIADLLAPEFASFPYSPTGKSYYNQSFKPLPSIQQAYQKSLGSTQPTSIPPVARTTPTQPSITGQRRLQKRDFLTKSLGKGVDFIQITSLVGDGRNHGGIDIAAPSGTYIALRVDCEVVATGVYGDYGLLIDVWVPSLGIQLRMAHLSSVLIKSGKIPAGTSFARVGSTGRSRGPHIHLEYDTKKGTRGGGAINDDPNYAAKLDQYVRLLLLTRNKNKGQFTPAPTPMASLVPGTPSIPLSSEDQVEMQTNTYLSGLLDGITQERQGRKIVIIDDRSSASSQQIVSSSGGDDLQIQIPDSVLLNNFIKNKLLLDLNYL
jgi:murein DD-endopeptidase MepM/ murein hydrolase activator NlpD